MDGGWYLDQGLVQTIACSSPPRSPQPERSDGRRHVFFCKKRGELVGKTKRGKGTKIMVLIDGRGLPLGALIANATPHEVTLIEPLLAKRVLRRLPKRLLYDRAADSDPLRQRLTRRGIELITPHRKNRKTAPLQDGRRLRRYRRRWKIERSISWLHNFRRLVTRYEYYAHLFQGFVQLACLIIVLRQF
jgi:transposase